jgi:hypothetical protein
VVHDRARTPDVVEVKIIISQKFISVNQNFHDIQERVPGWHARAYPPVHSQRAARAGDFEAQ